MDSPGKYSEALLHSRSTEPSVFKLPLKAILSVLTFESEPEILAVSNTFIVWDFEIPFKDRIEQ